MLKPESKIIVRIIFVIHELIVLRLLVQHEMWRDEIQAWSIAKASSTPLDVIRNTRFEGRPPLWQLIIWPLAKVFSDPNVMKILTFLMGSIAIWIWLHRSPQPLLLRACISFGFLFTGGYFVHSRDYIAMFLILMLITETFRRRGVTNSFVVLICGLSLINLFGLIIAGALVLSGVPRAEAAAQGRVQAWHPRPARWRAACRTQQPPCKRAHTPTGGRRL